ncbi:hypothetical protein [Polaribacter sp.]|uniref:hypothetical protein n=1 Tax=Polaribacter sp. TaxID=1920175 RepID=UPI003F6DA0F6
MADKVKKVTGKKISVRKADVIRREKFLGYNKFQLFICKLIRVRPAFHYTYIFNINYTGSHNLQIKDVLTDSDGNIYTVLKNLNRVAVIASYTKFQDKPNILGSMNIEGRKVQQQKKK